MTRRHLRTLACLLLALAALVPVPAASAYYTAGGGNPEMQRLVVVVLAPHLTWDDLASGDLPYLRGLLKGAMIANTNVSTGLGKQSPDTLEQGVLALSAGVWGQSDPWALPPMNADERVNGASAGEVHERFTGVKADSAIVHPGLPRESRVNTDTGTTVVLGTLGQAVGEAGGRTVAIGNSDPGLTATLQDESRPAATAAMDRDGLVDLGDVSIRMLRQDPTAPFGVRTDVEALLELYARSVNEAWVGRDAPILAVVDTGDLHRAALFAEDASPERVESARAEALETLDAVVRGVSEATPQRTLFVVSPAVFTSEDRSEAFAPLVLAPPIGRSSAGTLVSSSTHRTGLVTLLDVTATVLDTMSIDRPVQVIGNEMRLADDGLDREERIERLGRAEQTAASVDLPKGYVQAGYIVFAVVMFLAATLMLVRSSGSARGRAQMRALILLVLSMPVAGTLMFVPSRWPGSTAAVMSLFAVSTLLVWLLALLLWRLEGSAAPVAFVSGLTVAVLLLDQWLGGPWSFTGLFSFSPILGARYYGMGNEQASMLVGALLVAAALVVDLAPERYARPLRVAAFPVLGLAAVATVAAPFFGANVGVAIWGTIAVGVAWAGMNGRRVGWKSVVAMVVVVLVLIAAFSFIDLGGGGAQTHLGRAWDSAGKGGLIELWTIASRKAETNLRVLTRTNWSYLLVVTLGLLAYMRARPQGAFRDTLERYPAFAAAMSAGLIGGLFGYLTEDSGIVIPALVMLYVGGAVLYLMLGGHAGSEAG